MKLIPWVINILTNLLSVEKLFGLINKWWSIGKRLRIEIVSLMPISLSWVFEIHVWHEKFGANSNHCNIYRFWPKNKSLLKIKRFNCNHFNLTENWLLIFLNKSSSTRFNWGLVTRPKLFWHDWWGVFWI